MRKPIVFTSIILGILMAGLFAANVLALEVLTQEELVQQTVSKDKFIKVADNFIVLFDSSSSMDEPVKKGATETQYDVAKRILTNKHMMLPDLGYNGGLYLFTPYKEVYPMGPYVPAKYDQALDSLPAKAKGPTFLEDGLLEIEKVMAGLSGKTAVFIFSDGTFTEGAGLEPSALTARIAQNNDVCFYIISDAQGSRAEKAVTDMAKANSCSRVIPFDAFIQNPNYISGALYLVKSSEEVVTMTEQKLSGVRIDNIMFNFNLTDIRPEFEAELNELGKFLQQNPTAYAVIAGFTDNVGSPDYNTDLSYRRAQSVADYLMNNFNITPERLVMSWYGLLNPVASNDTPEGRALNRRVELAIGGF